jgi:hypothetical protein
MDNREIISLIKAAIAVCVFLVAGFLIFINASLPVFILCLFPAWILIFLLYNGEKTSQQVNLMLLSVTGLLLIIFLASMFGVFLSIPNQPNILTFGFVKIQPLTPSIAYRNTNFTASFTNALRTAINLTDMNMKESISDAQCDLVTSSPAVSVKSGGTVTMIGVCPQKRDGEAYDMIITIKYNTTMSGITTNQTETGHIKGQGEAY